MGDFRGGAYRFKLILQEVEELDKNWKDVREERGCGMGV